MCHEKFQGPIAEKPELSASGENQTNSEGALAGAESDQENA
jgi:hypothetical protein